MSSRRRRQTENVDSVVRQEYVSSRSGRRTRNAHSWPVVELSYVSGRPRRQTGSADILSKTLVRLRVRARGWRAFGTPF